MIILTITGLILAITGLTAFLNRYAPFKICPLCAGVSGTWLTLTALVLAAIIPDSLFLIPISILMGGTVVGIGYQGEKRFPSLGGHLLRFRIPVTVIGFIAVYGAVQYMSWSTFIAEMFVLAVVMYAYFLLPSGNAKTFGQASKEGKQLMELEEKMKDCC